MTNGAYPIHWAAGQDNLAIAQLLVEAIANVEARNGQGNTAVKWCDRRRCLSCCLRALIDLVLEILRMRTD